MTGVDAMKEIKAYVHRNRVADVVRGLNRAGLRNISIVDVRGMLRAMDSREQEYSVEIGHKVITEVKVELVCAAAQVADVVGIIRNNAQTGYPDAGWIFVSTVEAAYEIGPT